MVKSDLVVGLDVGSTKIVTCVGQKKENQNKLEVIGVGLSPTSGIRRGVVTDVEDVISSISSSLEQAERMAGVPLSRCYLGIGGSHIGCLLSRGVVATSHPEGEITQDDVKRVVEAAQAVSLPSNSEILHVVPKNYIVDGEPGITDPVGMNGVRLEVETLIIYGQTPVIKNLTKCVLQAGIDIKEFITSPLASARSVLDDRQKELGVILIEIGGGTTQLAVYEEGELLYVSVLPVGASHITNDLAIGLRTSIDVAEKVKLEYGLASSAGVSKKETIDLKKLDKMEEGEVSRFQVAEIIEARLEEIFSMVRKELKGIGKDSLLPAGAVLTGGGAKLPGIVDFAKEKLRLPAQIGFPGAVLGIVDKISDPMYATCVGLCIWGFERGKESKFFISLPEVEILEKIKRWFKSFLP